MAEDDTYEKFIDGWFRHLSDKTTEKWDKIKSYKSHWEKSYSWDRRRSFSPIPETVDIAINSWCNYGCTYCYTDATTRGVHAPIDLIENIIKGFDQPPYQVAYGGGSPTQHPDFIKILQRTRELGVVPNYTTEGQNLTDEILEATNSLCGGVALTFHAWRGLEIFAAALTRLQRIKKQINIHIIADKEVVKNLEQIRSLKPQCGVLNLVLLAYYPDVGRSNLSGLMPKHIYMREFPDAVKRCLDDGHQVAFSEGLLPFFLSRPEIGVDTRMATPSEGRFSCYVDVQGYMSSSSFVEPWKGQYEDDGKIIKAETVFDTPSQLMWNKLRYHRSDPFGARCDDCKFHKRCATPNEHHYFICKYAEHNDPESQPRVERRYF